MIYWVRRHIKKHHIHLGWATVTISFLVILVSFLWESGAINLPSSWIYYARQLSAGIIGQPKPTFELAVKFHKQEHSLSCEAATLKMVLDFYGLNVSESEIIKKMPFDPTPKNNGVWGDPDKGFVGNIDGRMPSTGYGIHWKPLAETARNWRGAEIIEGGLAGDLTRHLLAGRPVIVWGYLGRGRPLSWQTPDGKKVSAINGEHTRVVYGFRGSPENPDGFFLMDPTYGAMYWEKNVFLRNWDAFGRSGIVVYP